MKSNNKYNGSNEYEKAIDFLVKGCVLQEFPKYNLQN